MIIKSKKGFITHPLGLAFIAFLLGIIVAILVARGIIPFGTSIVCPIS
ncbi:MAG: hypothetical protein AABY14_02670 [Nanoarchaeota archaeon]|jgi:hypothetical protein